MYADDTSISASSENPVQLVEHLKRELEGIMNWLRPRLHYAGAK